MCWESWRVRKWPRAQRILCACTWSPPRKSVRRRAESAGAVSRKIERNGSGNTFIGNLSACARRRGGLAGNHARSGGGARCPWLQPRRALSRRCRTLRIVPLVGSEAMRQAAHEDAEVLRCWAKLGNEIRVIKVYETQDEVSLK